MEIDKAGNLYDKRELACYLHFNGKKDPVLAFWCETQDEFDNKYCQMCDYLAIDMCDNMYAPQPPNQQRQTSQSYQ